MKFTTIRIEGAILSSDILDKIEQGDISGQSPADYGFTGKTKVKDEIARVWADAQDMWRIFSRQREKVSPDAYGASQTRKFWIVPLLGLLGYDLELAKAEYLYDKSFAVSHRAVNLDRFPVHIMGFNDSLDKKRSDSGPRMSPHALIQEYINLTEHLYAIVTNGVHLRVLRDSSRLIKQSFIEFDLETMMNDEHFADFAVMFRLIHASRAPKTVDQAPECRLEKYHQDALDSGSRIREGLSLAVERSIRSLAGGFLAHPGNQALRNLAADGEMTETDFYQYLLRLIYRLLFLMVIEERNLIYPNGADKKLKDIYTEYYSVGRLRKLCDKRYLADARYDDLWISLKNTFRLFESADRGKHLGIAPLAGDLFGYAAVGPLNECRLDNKTLLECLKSLSIFTNKHTGAIIRVNYGSLNVEEFGSVYEGLLEYAPRIIRENGAFRFDLVKGSERSSSGSHYTPDELVQPLIKHSLDYIIDERLKAAADKAAKERALLSIKVCDVACGSGHILLNVARRIGTELARVRTGEDQPSPSALRQAVRDVIRHCIYGVDKNPLAVELCKVAFWLEAHNPGEPLNFLDHHIKCGDAIVGLAHKEELENGIADEAFKRMPHDDKDIRAELAKRNKHEREKIEMREEFYRHYLKESVGHVSELFEKFNRMPETTVAEIEHKRSEYQQMTSGQTWWRLKNLADIQVAQFFIPKNEANAKRVITDDEYRGFLRGAKPMQGPGVARAMAVAQERRFFHWFLEFPEVFADLGFDCILGNPPFLGNRGLKGAFGTEYMNWLTTAYSPAGAIDLVGYFFRRDFNLIRRDSYIGLISTNTISQGVTREGSLDVIKYQGGEINSAIRSMTWPGQAAVTVSLLTIFKGHYVGKRVLNGKKVDLITTYLDDAESIGNPFQLRQNLDKSFVGSYILGKGFLLTHEEASSIIESNPKNKEVIFPYLNGQDLNTRIDQSPSRCVINFFDWPLEKAQKYEECYNIIEQKVKPERTRLDKNGKFQLRKPLPQKWWIYADKRPKLYQTIKNMQKVLVCSEVTKYCIFSFTKRNQVFMHTLKIIAYDDMFHYTVLNSNFHDHWAWKYCSTMGSSTLRYTPSSAFETFPFPHQITKAIKESLEKLGNYYHQNRSPLMQKLQLGLTKTYNLFHTKDLTIDQVIKESKQPPETCEQAHADILKLRELHQQMDETVLEAYGWRDINLAHDFYEVDYLPENDRIRYTISPESRKEILKRLLKLNHEIYEQEVAEGLHAKGKGKAKTKTNKTKKDDRQLDLF